jgi:hypothetical protein
MDGQIQISCGNAPLADGSMGGGYVEMLSINGNAVVQDLAFINAAWVSFADRFNKSNQLQFRVGKEHSDGIDSLAFLAGRRAAVPGVADFTASFTLGAKSVTLFAAGAKWDRINGTHENATSLVTYQVTTGQIIVTLNGGGGTPYTIPFELHASIAPLVVPAGYAAALSSGEDGFYFGAELSGSLTLASGSHCLLLPLP